MVAWLVEVGAGRRSAAETTGAAHATVCWAITACCSIATVLQHAQVILLALLKVLLKMTCFSLAQCSLASVFYWKLAGNIGMLLRSRPVLPSLSRVVSKISCRGMCRHMHK